MNLWAVYLGWGLFVVRAESEEDAQRVALDDPESGAAQYGHTLDEVHRVVRLEQDGPPAILADHYG